MKPRSMSNWMGKEIIKSKVYEHIFFKITPFGDMWQFVASSGVLMNVNLSEIF